MGTLNGKIFYIDVDDTFVRSLGRKRIPIPRMIEHIKSLSKEGALLYCWSSGGADYARDSAKEFSIDQCFQLFLPKPNVIIDDIAVQQWRKLIQVHPNTAQSITPEEYIKRIQSL